MKNAIIIILILFLLGTAIFFTQQQNIVFHNTLITTVPADTLWEYFELVFTNSAKTNWPNNLSIITSKGFKKDININVNYLSPIGSKKVTYRLIDLVKNERITYKSILTIRIKSKVYK